MPRLTCKAEPWDFDFDPATTCLLIIDMQEDFLSEQGYCYQYMMKRGIGKEAIARLRAPIYPLQKVLARVREIPMMVLFTIESHWKDMRDVPLNKAIGAMKVGAPIGSEGPLGRLMIRGEKGTTIVDELKPLPTEYVIDKPGKGSFFSTDLDLILRNKGITHLVLAGVTTDCCVLATRMEALDRGYFCLQLEDCTAATELKNHLAVSNMIRTNPQAFGLLSNSHNFLAALEDGSAKEVMMHCSDE